MTERVCHSPFTTLGTLEGGLHAGSALQGSFHLATASSCGETACACLPLLAEHVTFPLSLWLWVLFFPLADCEVQCLYVLSYGF